MSKPASRGTRLRQIALASVMFSATVALAPQAWAQPILPANFFDLVPASAAEGMAVSADTLVFDSTNDTVVANGNVGIRFEGYSATADRAIYYQSSGRVELVGNVAFRDPDGIEYVADRVELEDGFKAGFLQSLIVRFPDGTYFTAADTRFDEGIERVYNEGTYAPCGTCIDENGNRIGWTVKAARIVTDEAEQVIYFEQPSLQLLGVSVVALPFLSLPSDEDIQLPVLSYDEDYGLGISLPFFRYRVADGRLAVTPTIYTNQGVEVAVDWEQRIGDVRYTIEGSGVYQLNPGAYAPTLGDRNLRGAIQTAGTFTPTDDWTLGWSYTAFTDPGYLPDYRIASGTATNEVFARYLTTSSFGDIRIEQFLPVDDDFTSWSQYRRERDEQALTLPNARIDHVVDLEDAGRVRLQGKLLGLSRAADDVSASYSGNRYVHGYEGQSVHAMMQASWTDQYISKPGLVVSPYLGLRADAASYDGASAYAGAPDAQSLLSATPIAALDMRYPLEVRATGATTVIEPIVQMVYRNGPTTPGIINNDSQSTLIDTGNLFDFNRFSGIDRQETGLRSNVGAIMSTSFDNGGWLSASLGQSFHISGRNSYADTDGSTAEIGSSLEDPQSFVVGSLEAGYGAVSGGVRAQLDPATGKIPSANGRATLTLDAFTLSGTYAWAAPNLDLGVTDQRHDVGVNVAVPVSDYWTVRAGTEYDLVASELLKTRTSVVYDDSYLAYGLGAQFNGPVDNWANDFVVALQFRLSTAAGRDLLDFDFDFDND